MSVRVSLDIEVREASNTTFLAVSGCAVLAGFGVDWTFTNTMESPRAYTIDRLVRVTLQPRDASLAIPSQPVPCALGDNPYVFVSLLKPDASPASDVVFVGRIERGAAWHAEIAGTLPAAGELALRSCDCTTASGPSITFDGRLIVFGLLLRVYFSKDSGISDLHASSVAYDFPIIGWRTTFSFPNRPVVGQLGGDPWILTGFIDGNGKALAEPVLVGRCTELSDELTGPRQPESQ